MMLAKAGVMALIPSSHLKKKEITFKKLDKYYERFYFLTRKYLNFEIRKHILHFFLINLLISIIEIKINKIKWRLIMSVCLVLHNFFGVLSF